MHQQQLEPAEAVGTQRKKYKGKQNQGHLHAVTFENNTSTQKSAIRGWHGRPAMDRPGTGMSRATRAELNTHS